MVERWTECWQTAPEIHILLKESESLETAREKVIKLLEALEWSYRKDIENIPSWDYILLKEAVRCFKNIISIRNERLSGHSTLKFLWEAARSGDSDVDDAFIQEFVHLFKAIMGHSDVYPNKYLNGLVIPDFQAYKGQKAAQKRSEYLDDLADRMDAFLKRYTSGLDKNIIEVRKNNRSRILDRFGATIDDWNDWKWQFKNVLKDANGLEIIKDIIKLTEDEEKGISLAIENDVPFGVTPHYLHLMDQEPSNLDFAVRRQVFPPVSFVQNMIEHKVDRETAFDFMREHDTSPIKLVTRRYPKVAIIKPYDSCPQICVYCQRNWEITAPLEENAMASDQTLDCALEWYDGHDKLMDILVTGGDPLVMNEKKLEPIIKKIDAMDHVKNIRIATRIPITVPQRITKDLVEMLGQYYEVGRQTICMVVHFTHPYEVTPEVGEAIRLIRKQGLSVYNQTVYSFAVSRRFELSALRMAIKSIGVIPYYTFNMKGKSEIEEYSVPVARLLQEGKEEARLLPGLFRTDKPVFNVPALGKNHLKSWQDHELIAIHPQGNRIYSFHPWEKNIAKVNPYIYTDVIIKDYLDKLKARGEAVVDYRSIWYYY